MMNFSWLPPIVAQASERLVGNLSEFAGSAHGLARGDRAEPLRQDRVHHQPDPQSAQLGAQSQPDAAAQRGGRAPPARGSSRGAEGKPAAAVSLPRQYREDGRLPDWPERTSDLSEIGIEVRFAPANTAGRLLSEITGNPASLTIRIVDYPGEWLLDLPLLGQSYAEWSRATLRLLAQRRPRRDQRRVSRLRRAAQARTRSPANRWRSRRMTFTAPISSTPATATA